MSAPTIYRYKGCEEVRLLDLVATRFHGPDDPPHHVIALHAPQGDDDHTVEVERYDGSRRFYRPVDLSLVSREDLGDS